MSDVPASVHRKIRRCLAVAQDPRGDPTTAATALRQAVALMRMHGIDPATGKPVQPAVIDWSKRTSVEARIAGLQRSVLCSDGWYTP